MITISIFLRCVVAGCVLAAVLASCSDQLLPGDLSRPDAPRNFRVAAAFASGSAGAELLWDAPANSAGIIGYTVCWRDEIDGVNHCRDVDGSVRSCTIEELSIGHTFFFSITARRGDMVSDAASFTWTSVAWPTHPGRPSGIMAMSLARNVVKLVWNRSADTGNILYRLHYLGYAFHDSGSCVTSDTAVEFPGLTSGSLYTFTLKSVREGVESEPATVSWPPDGHNADGTIELSETVAPGQGLILDRSLGGIMAVPADHQPSSSVQLMFRIKKSDPSKLSIGPAWAFASGNPAYRYDSTVFISRNSYQVNSLAEWVVGGSFDDLIPADGNRTIVDVPIVEPNGLSQGILVRTGPFGNYHYARVLVVTQLGTLLSGVEPNQHILLDISYQTVANVPHAKAAISVPEAEIILSHRRR